MRHTQHGAVSKLFSKTKEQKLSLIMEITFLKKISLILRTPYSMVNYQEVRRFCS